MRRIINPFIENVYISHFSDKLYNKAIFLT